MTDLRFYILVAIPLVGILANTGLFLHLSSRVDHKSDRLDARNDDVARRLESRIEDLAGRMDSKFDVMTGKVIEMANRLVRLEESTG